MAKKKKTKAQKARALKIRIAMIIMLLMAVGLYLFVGYINARIVRIRYTDVKINGLHPFLDGGKLLFLSDLNISDQDDARRMADLVISLADTKPDMIIFGGDFTGHKLSDVFKVQSDDSRSEAYARMREARRTFFIEISVLNGKIPMYAVAGEADSAVGGLLEDCMMGGVKLIENAVEYAPIRNQLIALVGYGDFLTGGSANFKYKGPTSEDTVIAITHNPDAHPLISSVLDQNGNTICDLVLAGHVMGPQINILGWDVLSHYSGPYESGIYNDTGAHMLVSGGVGTQWATLRLGSQPEVHMITLKRN